MTPSRLVLVIAVLGFLFGMVGVEVFSSRPQERIGVAGWLVRGLVGLAVAHTSVGIYQALQRMKDYGGDGAARDRGLALSDSVMSILVFGGILVGLAGLLHVVAARGAAHDADAPT